MSAIYGSLCTDRTGEPRWIHSPHERIKRGKVEAHEQKVHLTRLTFLGLTR